MSDGTPHSSRLASSWSEIGAGLGYPVLQAHVCRGRLRQVSPGRIREIPLLGGLVHGCGSRWDFPSRALNNRHRYRASGTRLVPLSSGQLLPRGGLVAWPGRGASCLTLGFCRERPDGGRVAPELLVSTPAPAARAMEASAVRPGDRRSDGGFRDAVSAGRARDSWQGPGPALYDIVGITAPGPGRWPTGKGTHLGRFLRHDLRRHRVRPESRPIAG